MICNKICKKKQKKPKNQKPPKKQKKKKKTQTNVITFNFCKIPIFWSHYCVSLFFMYTRIDRSSNRFVCLLCLVYNNIYNII